MTRFILSSSKTHLTPSQNHRQMEWFSKRCLRHRQHWLPPHTRSSIRCHYTKSNPIDDHSNIFSKMLQKQNFKPLGHYTCLQCGTSHFTKSPRKHTVTYHFSDLQEVYSGKTVRFTQNVSCNIFTHPIYQQVANVTV